MTASTHICIFEDKKHSNFLPLSLSRPVFDLRIGCGTLQSRLLDGLPFGGLSLICREYLADTVRSTHARAAVNEPATRATLFVNGRWLGMADDRERILGALAEGTVAVKGGYVVAARVPAAAAKELSQYLIRRLSDGAVAQVCAALRDAAGGSADGTRMRTSSRSSRAPAGGHEDEHAIGQDGLEERLPAEIEQIIERHRLQRVAVDDARLLSFPWQLIEFNLDVIADDFARMPYRGPSDDAIVYPGVHIVDPEHVVIGAKSVVRAA